MKPVIKLMPKYGCWPLWWESGHPPDNIDARELPLSTETTAALIRWADDYDATLNQEYLPDSAFPSAETEAAFYREGTRLWLRLREELGNGYEVVYYREEVDKT